jgi:hypothetical protein
MSVTIVDVMKEMGVEPNNELCWRVGALARAAYEWQYGVEPPKHLRPKTNERGSHCFALYPEEMKPRIRLIIENQHHEQKRQGDLFGNVSPDGRTDDPKHRPNAG